MQQQWQFSRHVRSCHSFNFILNVATMQIKEGLQIFDISIVLYHVTAFEQRIVDNSKNVSTFLRVNRR